MKTIFYFTLALTLLIPHTSFANTHLQKLKILFSQHFNPSYVKNQCGQNILNFVSTAKSHGIDMRRGNVIHIRNKGGTDLDSVPAMRAREQGAIINEVYYQYFIPGQYGHRQVKPIPNHIRVRQEGAGKWVYYHAILEFDGHIFDFDFTNNPLVLPVADYVQEMFFPRSLDFHIKNRSKFGLSFANDDYETFIQRVQDELVLKVMPANSLQSDWDGVDMSLRNFRSRKIPQVEIKKIQYGSRYNHKKIFTFYRNQLTA